MKKFWIFILGVITAIVGFFIFTDKAPTADTPPINNEQQQPSPDDGTGTITPSDPEHVTGLGYPVSSVVVDVHNASDYYVDFCDANAAEPEFVDFLEFGKEYRCEITISDPDRIISAVSSSFNGYQCPYSTGHSYIFTVSNLDGSTPIFSVETVNVTEKMGVSVYGDAFSDVYLTDLSGNRVEFSDVYVGATYYCNYTVASNCDLTEITYWGGGLDESLSLYLSANESSSFSFCLTEVTDTFAISFSGTPLE